MNLRYYVRINNIQVLITPFLNKIKTHLHFFKCDYLTIHKSKILVFLYQIFFIPFKSFCLQARLLYRYFMFNNKNFK